MGRPAPLFHIGRFLREWRRSAYLSLGKIGPDMLFPRTFTIVGLGGWEMHEALREVTAVVIPKSTPATGN
jgi:hypothetical protein